MFKYKFNDGFSSFSKINNDLNLKNKNIGDFDLIMVNPDEIRQFINDKEGILAFIIKTQVLIKKYFPNSETYLKLHTDPEYDGSVFKLLTHIINDEKTPYENECIYDNLLPEFFKLENSYSRFRDDYSIIIGLKI